MKLYVRMGNTFYPLESGVISIEAENSDRKRTYPFIDGDRTVSLGITHRIKLRVMLPGDEALGYVLDNAGNCGVIRVRLTEGSRTSEFDCTAEITKMYGSGFAGTEAIIELTE